MKVRVTKPNKVPYEAYFAEDVTLKITVEKDGILVLPGAYFETPWTLEVGPGLLKGEG